MIFRDKEFDGSYIEERLEAASVQYQIRKMLKKQGVEACVCEKCHETFPLGYIDIHHLEPIAIGGKADGDTVTLCRKCHYAEHGKEYDPKSIIIDESEWQLYARENLTQDDIAKLHDVRKHVINRSWYVFNDKKSTSWPKYKKKIRKEQ